VPDVSINRTKILPSTPLAIEQECKWLLSKLTENNFSEEDVFAIHLSLEEAFINAIKHGNKMDESKSVNLNCCVSSDKVEISLSDEGSGFEPVSIPDPRCDENLYKTGGRGLFLMRSFMDTVEYNEQGNCVYMVKRKSLK